MSETISLTASIGKVRGHVRFKENRVAKLLHRWAELEEKFEGLLARGRGETDTARLAYACLVMMDTGIRVGNEGSAEGFVCENKFHPDYGKEVQTFGLTTLLNRHVEPCDDPSRAYLELSFTGKKLVAQSLSVDRPSLIDYCPEGPDDELWLGIDYGSLYRFVKTRVGAGFSPKDIRAARVNQLFVERFMAGPHEKFQAAAKVSERKAVVREVVEGVAASIGHTSQVCKGAYLSSNLQRVLANWRAEARLRE